MTAPTTLIKYPTRSRPKLFFQTLGKWLTDPTVRVLVSIDADDATCNNTEFLSRCAEESRVSVRVGNSKTKVEAINDGVAEEPWEFLIVAADDLEPQRSDYASYLRGLLFKHFPDGDGVLHLNDGRVGPHLNTLNVMGRKYFDRFGFVYADCYKALWCDNEFQDVSQRLGKVVYVDEVVIRHNWIGAHNRDALLIRNESWNDTDAATYRKRKKLGFPVMPPIPSTS